MYNDPSESIRYENVKLATCVWIGIIAGIISAFVKSGFETVFPPINENEMSPPIAFLHKIGFHSGSMTYQWLGYKLNWGGEVIHILFSVIIAVIYCLICERVRFTTKYHGICFGLLVSVFAHGLIVPLLGLSGWLWLAGKYAIFSEFIGTALWIFTIESIRKEFTHRLNVIN